MLHPAQQGGRGTILSPRRISSHLRCPVRKIIAAGHSTSAVEAEQFGTKARLYLAPSSAAAIAQTGVADGDRDRMSGADPVGGKVLPSAMAVNHDCLDEGRSRACTLTAPAVVV